MESTIDLVCNKLNRFVFALKRLRQTVSFDAALMAYHGYVSSVLSYGLLLWGNSVDVDRAFKIKKKCIRAICNAWSGDTCKPLFIKHNILPLPCMYIRDICVFVKYHSEYWKKRSEVLLRKTRAKYMNLQYKPPARKDIYKKNSFNMCILLYNCLPERLRLLDDKSFKRRLSEWLLHHCFYSVREFINRTIDI